MIRAARDHPGLQLGIDRTRHLGILQSAHQVRLDFHELAKMALRTFNTHVRSMFFHKASSAINPPSG
jgi:hypothetical protein